jgi:alkaline phosphatase
MLLIAIILMTCHPQTLTRQHKDELQGQGLPRNIILFIGDGMGVAHITALKTVLGTVHLESFKTIGLLTTHATDGYITDSAAGATAMATGVATYQGAVSVSPTHEPLKTVLEYAEEQGKSTGLVATCRITHATPACFAAHVDKRSKENEIAEQLAQSKIEVLFGGGMQHFIPARIDGAKRTDNKDLIDSLKASYKIVKTPEAFKKLGTPDRVIGLWAMGNLPKAKSREISLAEMTRKAIDILSINKKGFFLMVEGSQIDWGGHDNDIDYILEEMIDFDEAVGVGLQFAEKDRNTLILVTSDHETGGLALEKGSVEDRVIHSADFTTTSHTGEMVPLFAYGPGSPLFGGIHANTYIGKTMIDLEVQSNKIQTP